MKNISKSLSLLTGAALTAGLLTACDDDKQLTLNGKEATMLTSIEIECSDVLQLPVGMDSTLVFTCGPDSIADAKVVFKSADETIATVDQDGTVHGVGVGQTTISALSELGFKVYDAEAVITVNVIPELIKAEKIIITNETAAGEDGRYYVTDQMQLKAEILPADHTYDLVKWVSSNENIATVDQNGLVTAVAKGDVTIKAIATDRTGVTGTYDFHFYELIDVEDITIAPLDGPVCISLGAFDLDVTYYPAEATVGSVQWESDNEAICQVARGRVTPVGFGTCNITAKCPATGKTQTIQVTVEPGWYIWNASNKWSGWICSNSDAPEVRGDNTWRISFPDAGTGKWRRDIKIDCSNSNMFTMHNSHPVLAIRCTIPKGGNNTWDVRDSGNPKDNNGYDLPDGTRLIMIDLTAKFAGWEPYHDFNLFQLKVADIPNANVDKNAAYYDVFWIRTFTSADEAKAFADAEAGK